MKNKLMNLFNPSTKSGKNVMSIIMAVVVFSTMVLPAFATTSAIVLKLIDIITGLFMLIGVILIVWAIGQLVLAFKNEDADSKSKAIMLMVVSCVLIGIKPLIDALGLDAYIAQSGI